MPTSLTSTGITFPDSTVQTTATAAKKNLIVYAASGSFTVPASITSLNVLVIAGGQGGGSGTGYESSTTYTDAVEAVIGEDGGTGSAVYRTLSTTPGTVYTLTVGAGGATSSGLGSNSSFINTLSSISMVAVGGGRAQSSTGGDVNEIEVNNILGNFISFSGGVSTSNVSLGLQLQLAGGLPLHTGGPTAVAFSPAGRYSPGAAGQGSLSGDTGSAGGVGGAVAIIY
jgi:hypothetical protein